MRSQEVFVGGKIKTVHFNTGNLAHLCVAGSTVANCSSPLPPYECHTIPLHTVVTVCTNNSETFALQYKKRQTVWTLLEQ